MFCKSCGSSSSARAPPAAALPAPGSAGGSWAAASPVMETNRITGSQCDLDMTLHSFVLEGTRHVRRPLLRSGFHCLRGLAGRLLVAGSMGIRRARLGGGMLDLG